MDKKRYLVGSNHGSYYDGVQVIFSPASTDGGLPNIMVETGKGKVAQGPVLPPAEMLEFRPHIFHDEVIDGKLKMVGMEQEPPGWFGRKCEEAGCEWFVSYVERMAAGEAVSLDDLKEAYRLHNHGSEMPESIIGRPFPTENGESQE